jgi:hypothetical protein
MKEECRVKNEEFAEGGGRSKPVKVSQTNLTIRFQIDARLAGTLAPPGARSPFIGTRSVDWILARDASGPVTVSPAQSHLVKPVWGSGKGDIGAARQRPPYQWEMVFVLVGQPAVNVQVKASQTNTGLGANVAKEGRFLE